MFSHWSRYLGLAERLSLGGNVTLTADPTGIIAGMLPRIFDNGARLNIDEFIQRMSSLMPIFEGGRCADCSGKAFCARTESREVGTFRIDEFGLIPT